MGIECMSSDLLQLCISAYSFFGGNSECGNTNPSAVGTLPMKNVAKFFVGALLGNPLASRKR